MSVLSDLSPVGFATLAALLLCSVGMVAIIWERHGFYRTALFEPAWLHAQLYHLLAQKKLEPAREFMAQLGGSLSRVYVVGLNRPNDRSEDLELAMGNQVAEEKLLLERGLPILGTVAVIAPFIGLFGTVVGIMKTFSDVAKQGQAGVEVVSAGVAEALVATAMGLFVAIGAVVFFNYLKSVVNRSVAEMSVAANRLSEMLACLREDKPFPADLEPEGQSTDTVAAFLAQWEAARATE